MNIDCLKSASLLTLSRLAALKVGIFRLRRAVLVLLAASLPIASPAYATAYCDGTIARIFTDRTGAVYLLPSFRGDWVQVCNLETTWKAVPPTTCTLWTTSLTSGLLEQKTFTFFYADPVSVCSAVPTYADAPSPSYVMINQ